MLLLLSASFTTGTTTAVVVDVINSYFFDASLFRYKRKPALVLFADDVSIEVPVVVVLLCTMYCRLFGCYWANAATAAAAEIKKERRNQLIKLECIVAAIENKWNTQ